MKDRCCHLLLPASPRLQSNALRVEIIEAAPRCALRPKTDDFGRLYRPVTYVMSGGQPMDAAHPCMGTDSLACPRNVEGEPGLMNDFISGPCPMCRRFCRRQGYGSVNCRECGYLFHLVERAAR